MEYKKWLALIPRPDSPWAGKMILNPALVKDSDGGGVIHMLFRATGPVPERQLPGKALPFPIYLGYAVSRDSGATWEADFETPALAPALQYGMEELTTENFEGVPMVNYANGAIEDPRLFYFENELYLSVACRPFPPGPYWEHDDPLQCSPEWAVEGRHDFGGAVTENSTVSLLYEVDLDALKTGNYAEAFSLVGPMHPPDVSDDRDVVLFPRKLRIKGEEKIVCVHRPKHPWRYDIGKDLKAPSIFIAAADSLADLPNDAIEREVLALPVFEWERNRIGASWAPIEISPGEWLLPYHGKQNDEIGYTQSFMILKETGEGFPIITNRPSERLMFADEPWELNGDFSIPCMFTCSGILLDDGDLLMGYGAADAKIGMVKVELDGLLSHINKFDSLGNS